MRVLIIQLLVNGLITASFYALAGVTWGVIYRSRRSGPRCIPKVCQPLLPA